MRVVNMHEAKTQLSKLVEAVESGVEDEIHIARNGKAAVRITSIRPRKKEGFKIGIAKGEFQLPETFDEPDEEFERLFYDGPIFPDE